jgi:hypothetical protein
MPLEKEPASHRTERGSAAAASGKTRSDNQPDCPPGLPRIPTPKAVGYNRLLGGGRVSQLSRICLLEAESARLLDNEKKVHPVKPEKPHGNIRDYCDDFTFQVVKELL